MAPAVAESRPSPTINSLDETEQRYASAFRIECIRPCKAALEIALLRRKPSRADEAKTRTLLASAIIDEVNAGERYRDKIVDKALATLAVAQNISR